MFIYWDPLATKTFEDPDLEKLYALKKQIRYKVIQIVISHSPD